MEVTWVNILYSVLKSANALSVPLQESPGNLGLFM